MPRKSRRRPTKETEDEYQERVAAWDKLNGVYLAVYSKSNVFIIELYYARKLLPSYINVCQQIRMTATGGAPSSIILVEDGDSSYSIGGHTYAMPLKEDNWVVNLDTLRIRPI